ncbi:MAG: D-beta-D-heptose 7-phosphate kinase/D-beta-D-heptose 1-phosphate adenosyltransferase [Candidatus Azotimanducaceae bacterium]|jgi:D-beta-D-heptose 7-phosphate kinase/D-beta-D-heptose 1-phosphate adenosyltransferase
MKLENFNVRFEKAKVLTIGDAMLDRYWHGDTDRVSAEAPIPVVDIEDVEERLGGAANVALNISALGAQSSLMGIVGEDESGQIIKTKLASAGIVDHLITLSECQTSTKFRIISRKQQLARADFERIMDIDAEVFTHLLRENLSQNDVVILSDYDKGCISDPQAFISAARKANTPVLVDPKFKDFSLYKGATLIKPNQKEFQAAVGNWDSEADFVEKCQKLIEHLGLEAILVTRGADGLTLVRKGQAEIHLPARNNEVYDVSGAGDTVIAVTAAALASGHTLVDAINLANIAAGIVVGRLGTASISGPELRLSLVKDLGFNNGVMSEEQLSIIVKEAQAKGEKVVFTNGCFDILHAGHVEYLSEARLEGDHLVVAINDDDSVHRLKGEGRPINNVERRMSMLAGLSAVDWVVPFSGDTPEALLEILKPDVLVKGGDYSIDQVVGADIVSQSGGTVKVLKLVDELSTTGLAQKIKAL